MIRPTPKKFLIRCLTCYKHKDHCLVNLHLDVATKTLTFNCFNCGSEEIVPLPDLTETTAQDMRDTLLERFGKQEDSENEK
jgi:transcription elongation factor Elf1